MDPSVTSSTVIYDMLNTRLTALLWGLHCINPHVTNKNCLDIIKRLEAIEHRKLIYPAELHKCDFEFILRKITTFMCKRITILDFVNIFNDLKLDGALDVIIQKYNIADPRLSIK